MILDGIKARVRRWVCPDCDGGCEKQERRLNRAEQLHAIFTDAMSREAVKQKARTSDMRVVVDSAVMRLSHAREEMGRHGR
jgi:hypothetical protein